jgi:hypothetical protein
MVDMKRNEGTNLPFVRGGWMTGHALGKQTLVGFQEIRKFAQNLNTVATTGSAVRLERSTHKKREL